MGRRRYRKQDEEEGLLELAMLLARRSAVAGIAITFIFVVAAGIFYANPKGMYGLASVFAFLMLVMAGLVGIATLFGIVSRLASGLSRPDIPSHRAGRQPIAKQVQKKPFKFPRRDSSTSPGVDYQPRPSSTRYAPSPPQSHSAYRTADAQPARTYGASTPSMLSKGEMAFYLPLCEIVAGRFIVQIKPSLVDVLQLRNDPRWEDIAKMHIDFLLCDAQTLQPRLAIELDDRSHRFIHRRSADGWKAELLQERRIPLLRQKCQTAYDVVGMRNAIETAIGRGTN